MNSHVEEEHSVINKKMNNLIKSTVPNTDVGKRGKSLRTYSRVPKVATVSKPTYKCEMCCTNFNAFGDLREHKQIFHTSTLDVRALELFVVETSNAAIVVSETPDIASETPDIVCETPDIVCEAPDIVCETPDIVCETRVVDLNTNTHHGVGKTAQIIYNTSDKVSQNLNTVIETANTAVCESLVSLTPNIVNNSVSIVRKTVKRGYIKKKNIFACGICEVTNFRLRKTRNDHIRNVHGIKSLGRKHLFGAPVRSERVTSPIPSSIISIPTPKIYTVNSTTLESNKFPCDQCYFIFNSELGLKEHKQFHAPKYEVKNHAECNMCNKVFKNATEMKDHLFLEHNKWREKGNVKKLLCQICGSKLTTHFSYKQHMRMHDKEICVVKKMVPSTNKRKRSGYDFICPICNVGFETPWSYKCHLSRKHKKDLPAHTKAAIKQGRNFFYEVCIYCSKPCYSKSQHDKHLKTHGKIPDKLRPPGKLRPLHKCGQCRNKVVYQSLSHLMKHQKSCKKKDQTLYCDQCSLTCPHTSSLRKHYLMAHNKSLPHSLDTFYRDDDENDYEDCDEHLKGNVALKANALPFVDCKFNTEDLGSKTSSFTSPISQIPNAKIKIEPPDDPEPSYSIPVHTDNKIPMDFKEEFIIPNYLDSD